MVVDLIYVEYTDCRTMAVAIVGTDQDDMLGPVDSKGAVSALAPMLRDKFPDKFPTVQDAENTLSLIHARNMFDHRNSAGQDYPYKINSTKS